MSFLQQGQKYMFSAKEYIFYIWNKAEAADPEYPCCIKLRSVIGNPKRPVIRI